MLIIELSEFLQASIGSIWPIISDPHRQREFAGYQIQETERLNAVSMGPEFRWRELGVLLGKRYECEVQVLGWEPPQWYCFGTPNLFHVSFELEPGEGGTTIRYRVELPETPDERRGPLTEVCRQTMRNLRRLIDPGADGPTRA
jgi:hypothetical protein